MRVWTKIVVLLFAVAVLGISGTGFYYRFALPHKVHPAELKVERGAERVARGKYLFQAVSACGDCHSARDFTHFAGPARADATGQGMVLPFDGLPGRVVASNITPDRATGIGTWSDGEKLRAIRDGVSKDGHPIFPIMPYVGYRAMSDEDAESLVAYLDSLSPIAHALPATNVTFPVSLLIRSAPRPAGHVTAPARSDAVRYGEYLVALADCMGCHTQEEHGQMQADKKFGGGRKFVSPVGPVVSANISPDRATGIGSWTEDMFVQRLRAYRNLSNKLPVTTASNFTVMPWLSYCQMEESDLRAIFKYLQAQAAVSNRVSTHPAS